MRENASGNFECPRRHDRANFLVAETGGIVVVTNEGDAELSAHTPLLHIVSVGTDKFIPNRESLAVFIRLRARSVTGETMTLTTWPSAGVGSFGTH
jgi:L-lactate utilization protein LutB